MQKMKVTNSSINLKPAVILVCVVLLSAALMTPLHAQLDATNSYSTVSVSSQIWELTNDDGQVATVMVQPFTNSGSFSETSGSTGWWMLDAQGNHAFRFNVGGNIVHDSGGDRWDFVNFGGSGNGYQSMGTATGTANGNFPYATSVSGTYTLTTNSGYGSASGSGMWSGVLVSGAPSGSSGSTTNPTYTNNPSSTSNPTPVPSGQLAARYYGNIGSSSGQAWTKTSSGDTPISSGQIKSGTEIVTGDNGIVGFEPPNQGGEVYLGANSIAGWVGLTSEPAPDNQITYMVYPPVSSGTIFPNGYEQFKDMLISMPIEATIAVTFFGEEVLPAAAVAYVVEGGAFTIPNGIAYIKENIPHLIVVPQGALAGENTEYTVNVTSTETTVQVIDGPVIFIDPITNNTVTVQTNQVLTLPAGQQNGFSTQDLQNDVSSLNSASVNQWWTQAASTSPLNGLLSQPAFLVVLPLVIVIVIVGCAVTVTKHRKKVQTQRQMNETAVASGYRPPEELNMKSKRDNASVSPPPPAPDTAKTPTYKMAAETAPQTAVEQPKARFCSSCGKQLPMNKNFCPFCGSDLNPQAIEK